MAHEGVYRRGAICMSDMSTYISDMSTYISATHISVRCLNVCDIIETKVWHMKACIGVATCLYHALMCLTADTASQRQLTLFHNDS